MAVPTIRDFAALVGPIPPGAVAQYRRSEGSASWGTIVVSAVIGLVVLLIGGAAAAGSIGAGIAQRDLLEAVNGVVVGVLALAGGAGGIAIVLVVQHQQWQRWYRMDAFARANSLVFAPESAGPALPGMIFGIGSRPRSRDRFRRIEGRGLDYGNYEYTTGSGKNRTTHRWGYLALELDRALPHMVLDARSNNSFLGTNLPASFQRDQRLSLEGDFDRYFTLYCPREYERDALYVFTPDLMALLIDEAAKVDVEIVDRWMLLYSSSPFALHEPEVQRRLGAIVDTVGTETLDQTERYRDERIPSFAANYVAPAGQRLRKGIPVGVVVLVVGLVAVSVVPRVLGWIG